MDDLSDEETELEEIVIGFHLFEASISNLFQNVSIRHRGFASLIPIGLKLTQQEEKIDVNPPPQSSWTTHNFCSKRMMTTNRTQGLQMGRPL
jgi:hypothetical protein